MIEERNQLSSSPPGGGPAGVLARRRSERDRRLLSANVRAGLGRALKGLVGIAVAIGIWELVRVSGALPRQYIPGTGSIVSATVSDFTSSLLPALGHTLEAWAIGLAITVAIGVALGLVVGLSRRADAALRVVVDFLRPIPSVALIPIAVLIFGVTLRMQLTLIVFACVWPVFFNVRYAVQSVDPLFLDTGRVSGLSRTALVRRVVLPSALPAIFTGVRIASSIALVLAVSTELVTGAAGLGKLIVEAQGSFQIPLSYAGVFVTGVAGFLINTGFTTLDRRLLPWSVATRGAQA
jgi:ABC-type nitrate/sulfonate/bicarbonate transport system permease component